MATKLEQIAAQKEKLRVKLEQLEAQRLAVQSRANVKVRKERTRAAILIGTGLLKATEENALPGSVLETVLMTLSERDREFVKGSLKKP